MDDETERRSRNAYVVCQSCGQKHGKGRPTDILSSTWHEGRCDICHRKKLVTEFRDYGYSKYE